MRIQSIAAACAAAGLLFGAGAVPAAESSPSALEAVTRMEPIDGKRIIKEAETLQRKADLIKEMAEKKAKEAKRLRDQAGLYRSQGSAAAQAAQQRAASNLETSEMLSGLFGLLGTVSPVSSVDEAAGRGLVSTLFNANKASDARALGDAQAAAGRSELAAERAVGPLELKAQGLEDDAVRLQAAANRVQSLVNAKMLLAVSEDLRLALIRDRAFLVGARHRVGSEGR